MHITEAFACNYARHESGAWRITKGRLEIQRGVDGDTIDWISVCVIDADYLPADGWLRWDGVTELNAPQWFERRRA